MLPLAAPAVNVIAVAVPKSVVFTVGCVTGAGEVFAPLKVMLCDPV